MKVHYFMDLKRSVIFLIVIVLCFCLGERANALDLSGHKIDFQKVFEGITGLDDVYREISTGMDSKNYKNPGLLDIAYNEGTIGESDFYQGTSFVRRFEEKFGSVPSGNHRLIGHWGLEGDIPFNQEPYKTFLSKYPKNEVVDLWQKYVNDLIDITVEKTGLPKQQAKGLVGVIYDTHLLGDYSTAYTDPLQGLDNLHDDILKSLNRLFGNNNILTQDIKSEFGAISKSLSNSQRAEKMQEILCKHNIGEKLNKSYGNILNKYNIKYKPIKPHIQAMREAAPFAQNTTQFADYFALGVSKIDSNGMPQRIQTVNGIMQEVEIKGKKALIMRVPFQFSTEQRAASLVAKRLIEEKGYGNLTPEFLQMVKDTARQTAKDTLEKLNEPISDSALEEIAEKAVKWAQTSPVGAALKDGIACFIIMEGITAYRYFETDMSGEEFLKETTKNLTSALLFGTATYCVVALGATPGGPIVIAVGIGVAVFTDFVFTHLEKEFTTPEFSFDDIIGGASMELQMRRSIWEPNRKDLSLFDYRTDRNTLFDYNSNNKTLFDYESNNKSLFDYESNNKSLFR